MKSFGMLDLYLAEQDLHNTMKKLKILFWVERVTDFFSFALFGRLIFKGGQKNLETNLQV